MHALYLHQLTRSQGHLFLRTGNARRILFLVDRLELEDQAWRAFVALLKNDYKAVIYKENRDDWRKAEIPSWIMPLKSRYLDESIKCSR